MRKPLSPITLRRGQPDDLSRCEALVLEHFQEDFDRYSIKWDSDRFASNWEKGWPIFADCMGKLAGFALLQPWKEEGTVWLHSVHVAMRYRMRGVGKTLMTGVEQTAQDQGYHRIALAVFDRSPALYWYQKLGYQISGVPYFQTQMVKELGN